MGEIVFFSQGRCQVTLLLPKIHELPVQNLRKLFAMMLSEPRNNQEAIQDTELFLENIVPDSKRAWHDASVRFQQEWRLIEKPVTARRTKKDIERDSAIRAHNDVLTRAVKKAKRQYERWVKIQALWHGTKHKMNSK